MTSRTLIPLIAALLLGGAPLADDLPRLPTALKLPQTGDSPGLVTFNHDMHVDTSKPAGSCTACHATTFRILGKSSPEKAEVVTEDGKQFYRYMRALPTQELCLNCHGLPERLTPAVQERLKALYPDDKAIGYRPGEIRGAMTIRKPV